MKKTKKRIRLHNSRMKAQQELKVEKEAEERKTFLILRKRKRKEETKERTKKFFDDRDNNWLRQQHHENLAIPSVITREGGLCTKKRSPLDFY